MSAPVAAGGSLVLTVAVVLAALTYLNPPVLLGASQYVLPFVLAFPVFGWGGYLYACLSGGRTRRGLNRPATLADVTNGLPKMLQALLAAIGAFGAVSLLSGLVLQTRHQVAGADQNRLFLGLSILFLTFGVTLSANHWLVRRDFDPHRTHALTSPAVAVPGGQTGRSTAPLRATAPRQRTAATRRSVVLGLACGLLVACLLGAHLYLTVSRDLHHYGALRSHGAATQAVVTSNGSQNHPGFCYAFGPKWHQYHSCGPADDYEYAHLQPGQVIQIVYDTTNPDLSCSCHDPAARYAQERDSTVYASLIYLAIATAIGTVAERRAR